MGRHTYFSAVFSQERRAKPVAKQNSHRAFAIGEKICSVKYRDRVAVFGFIRMLCLLDQEVPAGEHPPNRPGVRRPAWRR